MRGGFTPTQQRIIAVLSDGMPHTRQELKACLDDELAPLSALRFHICNLRKKLRPRGEDIICELANYRTLYRHVRLLAGSSGKKR